MRASLTSREDTAALAAGLAEILTAGDVLILTGDLGAGKTTFTQALGRALGIRGRVSSPTFVIAREHPSRTGGPGLVHVDAYRLKSADEFDDLGLVDSLASSVTVVEWGRGVAEDLGDHLDVEILRAGEDPALAPADQPEAGSAAREPADALDEDELDDERRTVVLTPAGPSWEDRRGALGALVDRFAPPAREGADA